MNFLTLENGHLGALVDNTVIDIPGAAHTLAVDVPATTLTELVEAGDAAAGAAWELAEQAAGRGVAGRAWGDVVPQAPIPVPRRNILCLGKNYLEHAQEVARKMDVSGKAPAKPPLPALWRKSSSMRGTVWAF